ncbi:MAG: carboxypeptidase-like regulatory domain-containing protein [Bacteroidota bacterium]
MMISRAPILFFLLLIASQFSYAQDQYGSLHVRVIDADSNEPLPYANVYIDQTTLGGFTNEQGEIDMVKIPFGNYTLMVSEISHLPHSRKIVVKDGEVINIVAKLPIQVLNEVKVEAKRDKQWGRQLERFEKLFFGDHAKDCKIENPWVLQFKVVNGDFIAEASEPLKIENNYLGYKIDLNLKNCFFSASSFAITSNARYQEMKGDEATMAKWKLNRESAYQGSPQHFFTSVIRESINKEGFEIYKDISAVEKINRASTLSANINRSIAADSLTGKVKKIAGGQYSILLPPRLEVHYLRKRATISVYTDVSYPVSWLEVKKGPVIVNRQGVIQNIEVLSVAGWMSSLRVADWLPQNYQSTGNAANFPIARPVAMRKDLLERAYVQTDRDYYYQTETMWLKGYMNYTMPAFRDTMSQTVYVDLVDPSGKVLIAKKYPIAYGSFFGDMVFDRTFVPGPYQLRAYTTWMLNFDPKLIFTRTIRLLQDNEAVRLTPAYQPSKDTLSIISLQTDKHSYVPREKITVTIDVTDSLDFRAAADLSISVTDITQVVPFKKEKTIMNSYSFGEYDKSITSLVKNNIEYGVAFNGRFFLGKKPVQGTISVYQDNSVETFDIATDDAGRFRRNLMFNDTLNFFFKAISYNNKKGIVVMDTLKPFIPQLPLEPLALDIYSVGNTNKRLKLDQGKITLLQEVAVKSTKIEKPALPLVVYGAGDYSISGDWINERNYQDIFLAILARVPGTVYDPTEGYIRFTSHQYITYGDGAGGGQPLILLDGVTMTLAQVKSVSPRAIDRIDILKYESTAAYGSRGGNGVILIYTRTGVSAAPPPDPDKKKSQLVKWAGYTAASKFVSPDYTIQSGNVVPDYRATIYWSPSIITDGKEATTVSFFAADDVTKYRIIVEGVTIAGKPLRAEKIVEIVKGH